MSPTPRFVRLALAPALLSLLFAFGCNSKDDSSNPTGTGGGTSGGSDFDDISLSATGALGFVDEFVSEVDALAAADFSNVTIDAWANASAAAPTPGWLTFESVLDDGSRDGGILGREGDGPGEFRRPIALEFLPGERLGVVQRIPGRIVCLDLEGEPRGVVHAGGPAGGEEGGLQASRTRAPVEMTIAMRERMGPP